MIVVCINVGIRLCDSDVNNQLLQFLLERISEAECLKVYAIIDPTYSNYVATKSPEALELPSGNPNFNAALSNKIKVEFPRNKIGTRELESV